MFTAIPHLVNDDSRLVHRGRHVSTRFLVESGAEQFLFTVEAGRVEVEAGPFVMPQWRFALRAERESWERFWERAPQPGWHDLFAMIKFRTLVAEGDLHPFITNLLWFKEVLAAPRARAAAAPAETVEETK